MAARTRASVRRAVSVNAPVTVSVPNCANSSFSRPAPMVYIAPACAFRSPMTSSGVRLLAVRNCMTSFTGSRRRWKRTGAMFSPSPKTSRAIAFREPGDCPPMSLLWPIDEQNATTSPSTTTGVTTTMSLGWGQPDEYGSEMR